MAHFITDLGLLYADATRDKFRWTYHPKQFYPYLKALWGKFLEEILVELKN